MWSERYILVSEGNVRDADTGQMLDKAGTGRGRVQEDTETDVAIEDDW
jgi:hypothetical protein